MTHNSEILIEVDKTVLTFENLLNEERIKELEELLARYDDLVHYYSEGEDIKEDGEIVYIS